jgi:hypothetical protein
MPRETIEIFLTEADPYQAGARFLAAVAYPDPSEEKERGLFAQALVRWSLEERIERHKKWADSYQVIRPGYFSGDQKLHSGILKRGSKKLTERITAAQFIAMPHFRAVETGRFEKFEGFSGKVNDLSILGAAHLGMQPGSFSTFKSRIWAPSRPVIHAATAFVMWHQVGWDKMGLNPKVNKRLAFLLLPEFVEDVVAISEEYRAQLGHITQFRIEEEETIQFKTTRIPDTGLFVQLPSG